MPSTLESLRLTAPKTTLHEQVLAWIAQTLDVEERRLADEKASMDRRDAVARASTAAKLLIEGKDGKAWDVLIGVREPVEAAEREQVAA